MIGKEGSIQWEITEKTTPTVISVRNMNTTYYNKEDYICKHEQLYGFDPEDMYYIMHILNKLIDEAKE